ncbi:Gfo/Idh/MocA family protein [Nitratireductor kimnyeongensis]|uniref:Gfo/Idh/MocA family protein n=1 Tax=Nitratireductor kimnyeongensis TaxID=430679 RepID=A0ABW0T8J9_9HYPH|nr:Gfo/Idh/MocA family oxidoreductase [Nitratireductor kimnyeongensis]QZZ36412.1 Gfo/Idh/MocA family oxidoreductase [Nitratireductor kimnyeongensis]
MPDKTVEPVRWGIVGTGTMADQFAEDLKLSDGAVLAAVSSRNSDKAKAFAVRHGSQISAHASYSGLLADQTVDAVYVATPNDTHFAAASAAIESGKGVLVEKPLVATSAEAARLAALAAERDVFLMEAMWTRFLPAITKAKTLIEEGAIGKVSSLQGMLAFHHPYDPESRFYSKERGGGAMLDLGVYGVSLSRLLMGDPVELSGEWQAAPTGVDRAASFTLRFKNDVVATLSCAFDHEGDNSFIIEGSRGVLVLPAPFIAARDVLECSTGFAARLATIPGRSASALAIRKLVSRLPLPGIRKHSFPYSGHGLQFEIEAASSAIRARKTSHPVMHPLDSARTLEIIETVLREENRQP